MRYWHNSTENRSIYLASSETQSIYHRNTRRRKSYLIIFFREKKDNWNILLKSLSFQNICSEEAVEYSCECPCPQFSLLESKPAYSLCSLSLSSGPSHIQWTDARHPWKKGSSEEGERERKKTSHSEDSWGHAKIPEFLMLYIWFQLSQTPVPNQNAFFSLRRTLFDSLME